LKESNSIIAEERANEIQAVNAILATKTRVHPKKK
jgi:hypothetical protein